MFIAAGTRLEHYVSTQIKSSAWMTGYFDGSGVSGSTGCGRSQALESKVRFADQPPRTLSISGLARKHQLCSVQPGLILKQQSETLASQ